MQHVNGKRSRRLPCLARQRPSRRRRPGVPADRRSGSCRRRSKGKHGQGLHARSRVRPARARCRGAAPGSDSGLGGAPASLRKRDRLPTAVAAVDLSDSRGSDTRPAGVPFLPGKCGSRQGLACRSRLQAAGATQPLRGAQPFNLARLLADGGDARRLDGPLERRCSAGASSEPGVASLRVPSFPSRWIAFPWRRAGVIAKH